MGAQMYNEPQYWVKEINLGSPDVGMVPVNGSANHIRSLLYA